MHKGSQVVRCIRVMLVLRDTSRLLWEAGSNLCVESGSKLLAWHTSSLNEFDDKAPDFVHVQ